MVFQGKEINDIPYAENPKKCWFQNMSLGMPSAAALRIKHRHVHFYPGLVLVPTFYLFSEV